jgi:glycosyltransferase involved in cell wall biosynthesis
MACGCAVVSTANCMIPEIIENGKNGLISNDPQELRGFLELLLKDEDLAKELGENARKTIVERYNLETFVDNWNKLFYSTVNNYRNK